MLLLFHYQINIQDLILYFWINTNLTITFQAQGQDYFVGPLVKSLKLDKLDICGPIMISMQILNNHRICVYTLGTTNLNIESEKKNVMNHYPIKILKFTQVSYKVDNWVAFRLNNDEIINYGKNNILNIEELCIGQYTVTIPEHPCGNMYSIIGNIISDNKNIIGNITFNIINSTTFIVHTYKDILSSLNFSCIVIP